MARHEDEQPPVEIVVVDEPTPVVEPEPAPVEVVTTSVVTTPDGWADPAPPREPGRVHVHDGPLFSDAGDES
jgi:hypothetical protein